MSKCPNCGQETLRTEDWACQWCGHPLPSGLYKGIKKTYRQLKEERLQQAGAMQPLEAEVEVEPKQDLERIKKIELEPEPVTRQKLQPTEETEEEPLPATEPEAEMKKEMQTIPETESETADEPETETVTETSSEGEPEEETEAAAQQELPAAELELTVDELFAQYEENQAAADENFLDKVIRVSGSIAAIEIKDMLDTYYIRLIGAEDDILESVQCMFDKKHGEALKQLEKGKSVTVQGRYNGSIIAVRIVDCFLV
jgi:hypothetical protein